MIYARAYEQDLEKWAAKLCVSIPRTLTTETSVHVALIGAPIIEGQGTIADYVAISLMGPCDGTCRQPGSTVLGMMNISDEMADDIRHQSDFNKLVPPLP